MENLTHAHLNFPMYILKFFLVQLSHFLGESTCLQFLHCSIIALKQKNFNCNLMLVDILIILFRLKDAKSDILSQTDECSRLKRVNTELESQIEQLAQDHQ